MDYTCSEEKDEKDVAVLVELLKSYETLEPHTRREAFGAIRSILCKNEMAQNYFRELQGVELMMSIYQHFKKLKDKEVLENALYTLGVATEKNNVTRDGLLTPEMFVMINGATKMALIPSAFLLLCVTSNNVTGQDLSRTTHCINKLCNLLKTNVAINQETEESFRICDALCTALCAMVSTPINSANQDICCRSLLPSLVRCLYKDISRQFMQSLIKLIGCCVIENSEAQTYFCVVGGIRAVLTIISKCLSKDALKSPSDFKFMMHLVNTLSCSFANHAVNKMQAVEVDVIEILLDCLQACSDHNKACELHITCVTAFLNLFDDDTVLEKDKQKFQNKGGIATLVELLTTKNEKLKKLVSVLLHKTFDKEANCSSRESSINTNEMSPDRSCITADNVVHESACRDTMNVDKPTCTNRSRDNHIFMGCSCRKVPYIDSHNVLKVLNSGTLCTYHTDLGDAISRYIEKVII
ncbi:hypothetical protein QZH41_009812 [Actinostola sp. cb2023]|nr:hypothetical protein QZH41_009812 [Actinostola sp. cb2023]